MIRWEDLATVFPHHLLVSLTSKLSFSTGTDAVEAPAVGYGRLFQVVDIECSSSAANNEYGSAVIAPDILCPVDRTEFGPLLLISLTSESLVSI